jgi:hypothetical protein
MWPPIVAHNTRQVRLHEQISSSIPSDIRTTDREHLSVVKRFPIGCISVT